MAEPGRAPVDFDVHGARLLVGLMLAIKVAVTAWNAYAYAYGGRSYDYPHHYARARVGGLKPGRMNYDPPLYYLPALLYAELKHSPAPKAQVKRVFGHSLKERRAAARTERRELRSARDAKRAFRRLNVEQMHFLRATNVLYIALFYLCWCFIALPRLLPDGRSWFLASTLLLALPGYQKLGVMTHPDNLFAATSALCVAFWLVVHERYRAGPPPLPARYFLGLAAAAGVVGLTRPFAVVPVAVFALVAAGYALRGRRLLSLRAAGRLLAVVAIVGALSVSWYAYRWAKSDTVLNAYNKGYVASYQTGRDGFDFVHYFTSFELTALWRQPNRKIQGSGEATANNSFFTVLYSEVWGDHWLHFSGPNGEETKLWPKRILFTAALPVVALLLVGAYRSLRERVRRAREVIAHSTDSGWRRRLAGLLANEREVVLLVWLVASVGLYLYWQTGPALLSGKNSTIKFIYTATFYPLLIALAYGFRPSVREFNLSALYLLALYLLALPVAIFLPG